MALNWNVEDVANWQELFVEIEGGYREMIKIHERILMQRAVGANDPETVFKARHGDLQRRPHRVAGLLVGRAHAGRGLYGGRAQCGPVLCRPWRLLWRAVGSG